MRRRTFLNIGLGITALGALTVSQRNTLASQLILSQPNELKPNDGTDSGDDICLLTPEQIEGPYYVKSPIRSNIIEDRAGLPLLFDIQVINVASCAPLEGYTVEIWHCDAAGNYSAFDGVTNNGYAQSAKRTTFLRGGQVSNKVGKLRFETIFPGWYYMRVAHIHIKVSKNGQSFLTSQVYFPDELVENIYSKHPAYVKRGVSPNNLNNDFVIRSLKNKESVVVKTKPSADKIEAAFRIGIAV